MDPLARLLIRLSQWLRRPPPRRRLAIWLAALALALVVVLFERVHGWPDWLTLDSGPRLVR
ncbi:MAG: hypothetical protein MUF65_10850 [Rubritepida sp.]|jgi:hypothetical protein|nr:hypothetical protein [Rubritepida sp.]